MNSSIGNPYLLRTAETSAELEAVFRFRYEHFFQHFQPGYPGLDHIRGRFFEPHDQDSIHYCAFTTEGRLCAVSTATSAAAGNIPDAWRQWFQLERLAPLGLSLVAVTARLVIHPKHRGTELFDLFYRFLMGQYLRAGIAYSVHYCSPGLIRRYEGLGHRTYGEPFDVPPGMLRSPMFFALNDPSYLCRFRPVEAKLCAAYALPPPAVPLARVLPELDSLPNFRLLSSEERLEYVRARLGPIVLPGRVDFMAALEQASILRLKKGLCHTAHRGGGFVCLVLSGAIREHGVGAIAGPGSFVGAGTLIDRPSIPSSFVVLEDAEVLVFDQSYMKRASRRVLGD